MNRSILSILLALFLTLPLLSAPAPFKNKPPADITPGKYKLTWGVGGLECDLWLGDSGGYRHDYVVEIETFLWFGIMPEKQKKKVYERIYGKWSWNKYNNTFTLHEREVDDRQVDRKYDFRFEPTTWACKDLILKKE